MNKSSFNFSTTGPHCLSFICYLNIHSSSINSRALAFKYSTDNHEVTKLRILQGSFGVSNIRKKWPNGCVTMLLEQILYHFVGSYKCIITKPCLLSQMGRRVSMFISGWLKVIMCPRLVSNLKSCFNLPGAGSMNVAPFLPESTFYLKSFNWKPIEVVTIKNSTKMVTYHFPNSHTANISRVLYHLQ